MKPLKSCRILVTPTSFARSDLDVLDYLNNAVGEVVRPDLGRPMTSLELVECIPDVDGFIAGLDTITAEVIEAANRLKVISRYGVGVDNIDLDAARSKHIIVTNTPGANSGSVAEFTLGLILALARGILPGMAGARAGGWPRLQGVSLENKTVALLGFGRIGQEVARRLAGFGCRTMAHDPAIDHAAAAALGVRPVSLSEAITQADFLSLHLPANASTAGMVNQKFLSQMKTGAFLINTARGELIDEEALCASIENGRLAGAAVDVFTREPPDTENCLLHSPRILPTPHLASRTDTAIHKMGWQSVHNCLAVLRGEAPLDPVIK